MDLSTLDEKFKTFQKTLLEELSFFPQSFRESLTKVRGFILIRPESRRYQEPGELCFEYMPPVTRIEQGNDYKVVVCSTKRRVGWVGKDCGWVIIVNREGRKVYTSHNFIRRSENFFDDLLFEARVARWRTFYRPRCNQCKTLMVIAHRQGRLKSCYWRCATHPEDRSHDRRFDDLEKPLPPEVQKRKDSERVKKRKRRERVQAEGKDPFAAFKSRMQHPWRREPIQSEFRF